MKNYFYTEPFPFLIVEDFYSPEELKLVWREFEFLLDGDKLKGPRETAAAEFSDGSVGKQNKGIFLDDVYRDRSTSNILTVNRKLFNCGLPNEISNISQVFKGIIDCNKDNTLLSYYENKDFYTPHRDCYCFTSLHWFYKKPKKFNGGDLYFPEFDIAITVENNKMILFPSAFTHGVTEVTMENSDVGKGYGRYCLSQFLYLDPTLR